MTQMFEKKLEKIIKSELRARIWRELPEVGEDLQSLNQHVDGQEQERENLRTVSRWHSERIIKLGGQGRRESHAGQRW